MIKPEDLRSNAAGKLQDAIVLLGSQRYDGAVYLAGYAVELALKARICDTLGWQVGYPETRSEFTGLASFKVHDLQVLLHLTGRESFLKQVYFKEWSLVARWDPEVRYKPVGTVNANDARAFLDSVDTLLRNL